MLAPCCRFVILYDFVFCFAGETNTMCALISSTAATLYGFWWVLFILLVESFLGIHDHP